MSLYKGLSPSTYTIDVTIAEQPSAASNDWPNTGPGVLISLLKRWAILDDAGVALGTRSDCLLMEERRHCEVKFEVMGEGI